MERNDGGFDQEAAEQDGHRDDREPVETPTDRELAADLGEVECPGAAVEQRDTDQYEERSEGIGDGEVEGAAQGPAASGLVRGERECANGHELEEDEQVEQVPG